MTDPSEIDTAQGRMAANNNDVIVPADTDPAHERMGANNNDTIVPSATGTAQGRMSTMDPSTMASAQGSTTTGPAFTYATTAFASAPVPMPDSSHKTTAPFVAPAAVDESMVNQASSLHQGVAELAASLPGNKTTADTDEDCKPPAQNNEQVLVLGDDEYAVYLVAETKEGGFRAIEYVCR